MTFHTQCAHYSASPNQTITPKDLFLDARESRDVPQQQEPGGERTAAQKTERLASAEPFPATITGFCIQDLEADVLTTAAELMCDNIQGSR